MQPAIRSRRGFLFAGAALGSAALVGLPRRAHGATPAAPFTLAPLPYAEAALEPVISARTMGFHYGKHHRAYVDNLNKLVAGQPLADMSLEQIVRASAGAGDQALFNNAAQAWNHQFYWRSLRPNGGGKPGAALAARIERDFGSADALRKALAGAATSQFGSGWAWLVEDAGQLKVTRTANADTPLAHGQ